MASVRTHRLAAVVWTVLVIPAYLWWRDSVAFVIAASVWANIYAALAAAEAADDRRVLDRLDRIAEQLAELVDPNAAHNPHGGHVLASPGRIVLVNVSPEWTDRNNGADVAPAVIVRAWPTPAGARYESINVRVMLDGPDVLWLTSVRLFQTEADVHAYRAEHDGEHVHAAYWPPRV